MSFHQDPVLASMSCLSRAHTQALSDLHPPPSPTPSPSTSRGICMRPARQVCAEKKLNLAKNKYYNKYIKLQINPKKFNDEKRWKKKTKKTKKTEEVKTSCK